MSEMLHIFLESIRTIAKELVKTTYTGPIGPDPNCGFDVDPKRKSTPIHQVSMT
jgi:hypothetical protein